MKINRSLAALVVAATFAVGLQSASAGTPPASGTGCCVIIPPAPSNTVTAFVTDYYPDQNTADSLFDITITNDTPLPAATYAAWCVDATTVIDPRQGNTVTGTYYFASLYSTCDTNELALIPTHAGSPPVGPPPVTSLATWHEVNYILNHRAGYFYWDVQTAINTLVGGPPLGPSPPYPPMNPTNVQAILTAASNNAAGWQAQCGDKVGVIFVVDAAFPEQILILEVPCCAVNFTLCPTNIVLGNNPPAGSIPDCTMPVNTNVVNAVSCCGRPVTISCSKSEATLNCTTTRILTYTATDGLGSTATCSYTITWTTDTNAPVIIGTPVGANLGCNPTNLPTSASIASNITATTSCSTNSATIKVTSVDSGSPCGYTRTFTITATDSYGNSSTNYTAYTWTVDTTAPTISNVPAGGSLGSNPTNLPTDASILAQITVTDNCTVASTNVSHVDSTNSCSLSRTFTITATDECNNVATKTVVYTWTTGTGGNGSICGFVFRDCNGDGILTPGIDVGISNIVVILKTTNGVAIATNTTDSSGAYCFYNLAGGTYMVCVASTNNCTQTAGCHVPHWTSSSGQDCWNENDGYQHCKGGDGVDRWTANDGYSHCITGGLDCWKDSKGVSHSQPCTYTSCNVPKNNCETVVLPACGTITCVNFAYQGSSPKCTVCVTGPSSGICGQTLTYTCCVTNTGNACFTSCQVTCCGSTHTCPPLEPGQGCTFTCNYQCKTSDYGNFNCQASASCGYYGSSNPCSGSGSCTTKVGWY